MTNTVKRQSFDRWNRHAPIIKPKCLSPGDTIGVFTPSSPSYRDNEGLFLNGLRNLERAGFKVKLGSLTQKRASQGYRSGTPEDRASEFMELVRDPDVHALMATIGGSNSSSMLPWLDFDEIRQQRKIICGYSDVTSLHLAIGAFARLSSFYGPAVMCWFGDWPEGCQRSRGWFLEAAIGHRAGARVVEAPPEWSNHARSWTNGEWQTQARNWTPSSGWQCFQPGKAVAPILAFNFNTLCAAAGTLYWPDLRGKILLLEDMDAPLSETERQLRQLEYIGAFDELAGLIVSKPELFKQQDAPFGYWDLWREVLGTRTYPIVTDFDCGHTLPMITIPQFAVVALVADSKKVEFQFLESATVAMPVDPKPPWRSAPTASSGIR